MAYESRVVATHRGDLNTLIVAPTQDRLLGRTRLNELRGSLTATSVDREMVEQAQRTSARAVVFRGVNEHKTARYGFSSDLSDNECEELGYLVVKSQMSAHRAFLRQGIIALVHADFGGRELDGLRAGTAELIRELASLHRSANIDSATAARCEVDLWILRNLSFYFAVSFEQVIGAILPDKAPLFELRNARIRAKLLDLLAFESKSA